MDRVKFYSPNDWAGAHNLEKSEQIILNFDAKKEYEINDILEFFNIYKYFDNKVRLKKWNENYGRSGKSIWRRNFSTSFNIC